MELETDQQLMPPRRCRSLAPMGGGVRHKKINGGRQPNGRLAPRLVVCVVHLILNGTKEGSAQCHATSRRTQSQAGGFSC